MTTSLYSYDQFPPNHVPVDDFLLDLEERGAVRDAMKNNRTSRDKIHEFDDLKNRHHEELAQSGITEDRLNEMDAELLDAMPPAVKAHVPGFDSVDNAPAAKTAFTANGAPSLPTKTGPVIITTPALE